MKILAAFIFLGFMLSCSKAKKVEENDPFVASEPAIAADQMQAPAETGKQQPKSLAVKDASFESKVDIRGYRAQLKKDQVSENESYEKFADNEFQIAKQKPLSTFSIDVDSASYSNTRRMINAGAVPPKDAVRIEEFINYFPYSYKEPVNGDPIAVQMDLTTAPWNPSHRLMRIGLKGRELKKEGLKPSNLVFLIDVSGSMSDENKLPLLKQAFRKLVENLDGRDRVSIVVYAGASGVVLEPTSADNKDKILSAIDHLAPGGSTNAEAGIELAYQMASRGFIRGGNNRVLLATDGDFNVGISDQEGLSKLIKNKADGGVYLSLLGFGMGNYKDSNMKRLSKDGNGNYFYIDTLREAEKVLVHQLSSTLFTIAKDVKIQIEFNPANVESYRLIGYENRVMEDRDFDDDHKDAGEIGAGFTVTALYEVVTRGDDEIANAKLRFKRPADHHSQLRQFSLSNKAVAIESAPEDLRFISAVAEFGMLLRQSPHKGQASLKNVLSRAESSVGHDDNGYRREFVQLVRKTSGIRGVNLAGHEIDR